MPRPRSRTHDRAAAAAVYGFSLPEVLIALALALLALLLGAGIALQVSSTARRLEAQNRADRALEAALEGLRGGEVSLRTGPVAPLIPPILLGDEPPPTVWLEVEASDVRDLYLVTARASYRVAGVPRMRVLQTKVWRP